MAIDGNDPVKLSQVANEVETTYGQIETVQTQLYGEINAIIGSGWQGPAARAFLNAFRNYDAKFGEVQNTLNTLHEKLVDSSIQYDRNEAEQSDAAAAMNAVING